RHRSADHHRRAARDRGGGPDRSGHRAPADRALPRGAGGARRAPAMSIAAIAAPVHARLAPGPPPLAVGQVEPRARFVPLVPAPGTRWLPNAIVLGAGPPVVWDPIVASVRSGPALAARGAAILRALGVARPGDIVLSDTATSPPRAAVARFVAALAAGGGTE